MKVYAIMTKVHEVAGHGSNEGYYAICPMTWGDFRPVFDSLEKAEEYIREHSKDFFGSTKIKQLEVL